MAFISSPEFGPLNMHSDPPPFWDPVWFGHSYSLDYTSVNPSPQGLRLVRPGQVFYLDPASQKLKAAYSDTSLGSYQSFLVSSFHDVTYGDKEVEVVVDGKMVESYCWGVTTAGTYTPSAYGTVPAAIKTQHPNLIFRP